eukprot:1425417-Rhodomonas_salina.2
MSENDTARGGVRRGSGRGRGEGGQGQGVWSWAESGGGVQKQGAVREAKAEQKQLHRQLEQGSLWR